MYGIHLIMNGMIKRKTILIPTPTGYWLKIQKHSSYQAMVHDAARYMPSIGKTVYRDSLWEVKTVLPISEVDDSRPILFKSNYAGISGYHCIMGGKIDNIYDCMDFIRQIERNGPSSS